jgi:hypothetical protein
MMKTQKNQIFFLSIPLHFLQYSLAFSTSDSHLRPLKTRILAPNCSKVLGQDIRTKGGSL